MILLHVEVKLRAEISLPQERKNVGQGLEREHGVLRLEEGTEHGWFLVKQLDRVRNPFWGRMDIDVLLLGSIVRRVEWSEWSERRFRNSKL